MSNTSRRKRFSRSPLPHLRLTEDDLAIIRHVARHRFLRSTHVVRLMPHRPAKKLIERMGQLYHAGYLDRPRAQLDHFDRGGSAPMVYAPGDRSGEVVPENAGIKWHDKNRECRRPYIEHTLAVADVMVALTVAVRARTDIELIDRSALLALRGSTPSNRAWQLTATFRFAGRPTQLSVVPDDVLALRFKRSARTAYFLLEVDRSTMPITRTDIAQTSYRRKLLTYYSALKARQHVDRFCFPNLRVLTVGATADRVRSMLLALLDITKGVPSGRFLFADQAAIAASDPLATQWCTTGPPTRIDV